MLNFHPITNLGGVVGIDPGMSGAFALIAYDGEYLDRKTDFVGFVDMAISLQILLKGNIVDMVVIEDVHAMPGQGVTSMFNFGRALGVAESQCYSHKYGPHLQWPMARPAPSVWKRDIRTAFANIVPPKYLGKGEGFDSRAICSRIWGEDFMAATLRRKKDHGTADALLLAYWGKYLSQIPTSGIDKTPRSIYAK